MAITPKLYCAASGRLLIHLSRQLVSLTLSQPIARGGTVLEALMLCRVASLGIVLQLIGLGRDLKLLEIIVGWLKERLAQDLLAAAETKARA